MPDVHDLRVREPGWVQGFDHEAKTSQLAASIANCVKLGRGGRIGYCRQRSAGARLVNVDTRQTVSGRLDTDRSRYEGSR